MNISHIKQKHKNKHLSLQHLGDLAYQQSKSATNYDSINSLTSHNDHYTLLYTSLVQELLNIALHNSNSLKNNSHFLKDISVNNAKSSSLDSSLSSSVDDLLPRDILFFLQIVSLYQIELHKGKSSVVYSSLKLAKILGIKSLDNYSSICDSASFDSDFSDSSSPSLTTTQSRFSNASSHSNTSSSSSAAGMRATILKMTAKLESLGLLKVFRRKRNNGMDKTNELIPVLPDRLYNNIKDSPANLSIRDSSKLDLESNLDHILRTKLFVPIELEFMKSLFKDKMSSKYKLFFLNCIMSAYRNFRQGNSLAFSATSHELMQKNNISRSTLDRIFRYIKQQSDNFFLKVEHKYTRTDDIDSNRYDKSIFVISINPLVFPCSHALQSQKEEISNINHDVLQSVNSPVFSDTYGEFETAWSKKQPSIIKKTALNNKDIILKNKYNKNVDYIDANHSDFKNSSITCSNISLASEENYKEEFFEDKLCLSSSESYNNSSFFNDSFVNYTENPIDSAVPKQNFLGKIQHLETLNLKQSYAGISSVSSEYATKATNDISEKERRGNKGKEEENTASYKELRHFYPLSEKDVDMLNFRANREFSINFVNQLLLKLYIKYPEKRFKNKYTFLSYMQKVIKNEKHQGPLVNHTTFRFSCNINAEEKDMLYYERYLSDIENSFDTGKEMQIKKKIAGRFSTNVAYEILTKVEFRTNYENSFILALVPNQLALSERQLATLSEQLEAVYGNNKYYVEKVENAEDEEVEKGEEQEKSGEGEGISKKSPQEEKNTNTKENGAIQTFAKIPEGMPISAIPSTTAWHTIRKGLIEEFGENIDAAWFARAKATECSKTTTLTLTMPTRFMADFMRNNYSHAILRLASSVGVKRVEYK